MVYSAMSNHYQQVFYVHVQSLTWDFFATIEISQHFDIYVIPELQLCYCDFTDVQ